MKSSAEIWVENDPYKMVERAGRVCYKSEDKITEDSAKPFVERMKANKHYAMLEHGTIYLYDFCEHNTDHFSDFCAFYEKYKHNPYSRVKLVTNGDFLNSVTYAYITTNLRVLVENRWESDLEHMCSPTDEHYKRATVHFKVDIGVGREITRHRVFSFAQESTRYCNYAKAKFNSAVEYIDPSWIESKDESVRDAIEEALAQANDSYQKLISLGCTPQEARYVLPLATKSELVMTGFIDDWKHFFDLRSSTALTGAPHPDMKAVADELKKKFEEQHLL